MLLYNPVILMKSFIARKASFENNSDTGVTVT